MMTGIGKFLSLQDELDTSRELVKAGFGELQEIDMGNTFYHLPHQLLASGFERLMKCYILMVHAGRCGSYPGASFMKRIGHDLVGLLKLICNDYFGGTNRPLMKDELEFLRTDRILGECMRILSLFGKKGRYYNFDVVTDNQDQLLSDPKQEWEALESEVEDPLPYANGTEIYTEYYPRVNQILVAKMERLARAIALQFTIGDHKDPDGNLRILSSCLSEFRHLRDLGTTDYRKSVRILRQDKDSWTWRSDSDILNSHWPTRVVKRDEYNEKWPFRADQVIVECRNRMFYIANIQGYAFALNDAARSRFQYPDVHDTGIAILGKSVGRFIDIASELEE